MNSCREHRFRHLPVMSGGEMGYQAGKLVGIFTATDACRALAEIIDDHDEEASGAA
jgi:CBS domain-containing protein